MIVLCKTKSGKVVGVGTGKVTSDPRFTQTKTGKDVCSFYICSDVLGSGKNKEYESYKVTAWNELANSAKMFEKGDIIYVEGECKRDAYTSDRNGKDEYEITASVIWSAEIGAQVASLQLAVNELIKKTYGKEKSEPTEEEVAEMFRDVQVPDFLREDSDDDLEPDI